MAHCHSLEHILKEVGRCFSFPVYKSEPGIANEKKEEISRRSRGPVHAIYILMLETAQSLGTCGGISAYSGQRVSL